MVEAPGTRVSAKLVMLKTAQITSLTWTIDEILQHALKKVIIDIKCLPLLPQHLLVHLPETNHNEELNRAWHLK
jgi:hypothetical protein